ncbi:MAG: class I SAM-dependent methyltransferase [Deltaproteobacteria bacterium]|nr:class I SAM-dependent methyltransferase [Deltaproteobacteria bacterium]
MTSPSAKPVETPARSSQPPGPYPAALYAAVHQGQPGDVAFYRRVCAGAHEVLELGCGFGRVARPLCDDGHSVTGVDLDRALLEIGRKRAPRAQLLEADFRELDLGRRFDRILCPFNGLYCLTSEADLIETLKRVREHLRPDGLFAFDVYDADDFHTDAPDGGDDMPELVATAEALGTTWDVFEASLWDRSEQRIDAVYTHVPHDGRPRVTANIPQRYLLSSQIEPLLAEAGLTLLALHGDFDEQEHDGQSRLMIGIAKPTPSA